ncbi:hypothetical protein BX666DRAFT_1873216 [Dichotomocladium elegans]|nr:hypothetical protein BX666DRAFT_1873216 [Dichotomocladium elegans]
MHGYSAKAISLLYVGRIYLVINPWWGCYQIFADPKRLQAGYADEWQDLQKDCKGSGNFFGMSPDENWRTTAEGRRISMLAMLLFVRPQTLYAALSGFLLCSMVLASLETSYVDCYYHCYNQEMARRLSAYTRRDHGGYENDHHDYHYDHYDHKNHKDHNDYKDHKDHNGHGLH